MKIKYSVLYALVIVSMNVNSEIVVTDDSGNKLVFEKPLERIISLAPHATELLFAAGATNQIVGTVNYSDYPQAAKKIPIIGSYVKVDYEKIVALQPQLVIYWGSGNPSDMINGIKNLKIKLFNNEPDDFEDIAKSIKVMGKLLGTEKAAENQATAYLDRLEKLRKKYAITGQKKIRVFYQVWNKPLMTINKEHLVNDVIEFCGGVNVFANLDNIAPTVDIESVIQKKPDVIITGMAKGREDWLKEWSRWKNINAVKKNQVYAINAELIVRQTPRILDGTEKMCEILLQVRDSMRQYQITID